MYVSTKAYMLVTNTNGGTYIGNQMMTEVKGCFNAIAKPTSTFETMVFIKSTADACVGTVIDQQPTRHDSPTDWTCSDDEVHPPING